MTHCVSCTCGLGRCSSPCLCQHRRGPRLGKDGSQLSHVYEDSTTPLRYVSQGILTSPQVILDMSMEFPKDLATRSVVGAARAVAAGRLACRAAGLASPMRGCSMILSAFSGGCFLRQRTKSEVLCRADLNGRRLMSAFQTKALLYRCPGKVRTNR